MSINILPETTASNWPTISYSEVVASLPDLLSAESLLSSFDGSDTAPAIEPPTDIVSKAITDVYSSQLTTAIGEGLKLLKTLAVFPSLSVSLPKYLSSIVSISNSSLTPRQAPSFHLPNGDFLNYESIIKDRSLNLSLKTLPTGSIDISRVHVPVDSSGDVFSLYSPSGGNLGLVLAMPELEELELSLFNRFTTSKDLPSISILRLPINIQYSKSEFPELSNLPELATVDKVVGAVFPISEILTKTKDVIESINLELAKLVTESLALSRFNEVLGQIRNETSSTVNSVLGLSLSQLSETKALLLSVETSLLKMKQRISEIIAPILGSYEEKLKGQYIGFGNTVSSLSTDLQTFSNQLYDKLSQFSGFVKETAAKLTDKLTELLGSLREIDKSFYESINSLLNSLPFSSFSSIEAKIRTFYTTTTGKLVAVSNFLLETLRLQLSPFLSSIDAALSSFYLKSVEGMSDVGSSILSGATNFSNDITSVLDNLSIDFASRVDKAMAIAQKAFSEIEKVNIEEVSLPLESSDLLELPKIQAIENSFVDIPDPLILGVPELTFPKVSFDPSKSLLSELKKLEAAYGNEILNLFSNIGFVLDIPIITTDVFYSLSFFELQFHLAKFSSLSERLRTIFFSTLSKVFSTLEYPDFSSSFKWLVANRKSLLEFSRRKAKFELEQQLIREANRFGVLYGRVKSGLFSKRIETLYTRDYIAVQTDYLDFHTYVIETFKNRFIEAFTKVFENKVISGTIEFAESYFSQSAGAYTSVLRNILEDFRNATKLFLTANEQLVNSVIYAQRFKANVLNSYISAKVGLLQAIFRKKIELLTNLTSVEVESRLSYLRGIDSFLDPQSFLLPLLSDLLNLYRDKYSFLPTKAQLLSSSLSARAGEVETQVETSIRHLKSGQQLNTELLRSWTTNTVRSKEAFITLSSRAERQVQDPSVVFQLAEFLLSLTLTSNFQAVTSLLRESDQTIDSFFRMILSESESIVAAIERRLSTAFQASKSAKYSTVQDIWSAGISAFKDVLANLKSTISAAYSANSKVLSDKSSLNEFLLSKIGSVQESVIRELMLTGSEAEKSIINDIVESVSRAVSFAESITSNSSSFIERSSADISSMIERETSNVYDKSLGAYRDTWRLIRSEIQKLLSTSADSFSEISSIYSTQLTSSVSTLEAVISGAGQSISKLWNSFISMYSQMLRNTDQAIFSLMEKFSSFKTRVLGEHLRTIESDLSAKANAIVSEFDQFTSFLISLEREYDQLCLRILSTDLSLYEDIVSSSLRTLGSEYDSVYQTYASISDRMLTQIADGYSSLYRIYSSELQQTFASELSAIRGIKSPGYKSPRFLYNEWEQAVREYNNFLSSFGSITMEDANTYGAALGSAISDYYSLNLSLEDLYTSVSINSLRSYADSMMSIEEFEAAKSISSVESAETALRAISQILESYISSISSATTSFIQNKTSLFIDAFSSAYTDSIQALTSKMTFFMDVLERGFQIDLNAHKAYISSMVQLYNSNLDRLRAALENVRAKFESNLEKLATIQKELIAFSSEINKNKASIAVNSIYHEWASVYLSYLYEVKRLGMATYELELLKGKEYAAKLQQFRTYLEGFNEKVRAAYDKVDIYRDKVAITEELLSTLSRKQSLMSSLYSTKEAILSANMSLFDALAQKVKSQISTNMAKIDVQEALLRKIEAQVERDVALTKLPYYQTLKELMKKREELIGIKEAGEAARLQYEYNSLLGRALAETEASKQRDVSRAKIDTLNRQLSGFTSFCRAQAIAMADITAQFIRSYA